MKNNYCNTLHTQVTKLEDLNTKTNKKLTEVDADQSLIF